jgi:hypothetical protein
MYFGIMPLPWLEWHSRNQYCAWDGGANALVDDAYYAACHPFKVSTGKMFQ